MGTVQGSILGPILYALFVAPLFDLAKMTLFADDKYVIRWNNNLALLILDMQPLLILDMQRTIEAITKWLRQSGLKVNNAKTEICLFHRKDQPLVNIEINGEIVISKQTMNVLGVTFDTKLQWQPQIQNTVNKRKKALHAIKLISKYFNKAQLLTIITSCNYSVLYYNAEIWLLPGLSPQSKQKLLSASASPLKLMSWNCDSMLSYEKLHYVNQRATPEQMIVYKHAILLHKVYNSESMSIEWTDLFFNQQFNARNPNVKFHNTSRFKVGNNTLSNRFIVLNEKIPFNRW